MAAVPISWHFIEDTNMIKSISKLIDKVTSSQRSVFYFLFCITLFVYANVLFGHFIFDDNIFIENNTMIRSLSNIGTIYTSSTTAGSGLVGDNFYRPNQQLIYTVLYTLFGLTPFFFHLVPILLHIMNGFLIFILFTKLGLRRHTALFGSVFFLLHPILTQAVSYISGLSEPLVLSSILLTVILFIESFGDITKKIFIKLVLLSCLVFILGLFSKESQVVSLGLIALIFIYKYKRGEVVKISRPITIFSILFIISIIFLFIRFQFLNFTGVAGLFGEINSYTSNLWVRLMTFIHILPEYFKMILWPWRLNYEKPYIAFYSLLSMQSIFSIISILAGGTLAVVSIIKKKGELFLGLSWFIIALLPVSGIIPVNSMYLEHWLYTPIIGLIFCICYLYDLYFDKFSFMTRQIILYILILILILFSFRIIARNVEWGDPIKFYNNELKYSTSSARIYNNLAMQYADKEDCVSAIPHYRKAIELNDSYPQTHHNLANCLIADGKTEEAIQEYLKALYLQPNFIYSLNRMRTLFEKIGDKRSQKFLDLELKLQNNQNITTEDIVKAMI